jgi:hypothetical protein
LAPTPAQHLPPPLRQLLAVNLGSSVVEALSEGGTLAVVFLAVEVLAAPEDSRFNWSSHPLLGLWQPAANWLNSLPATGLFISLLALAVLLQKQLLQGDGASSYGGEPGLASS